jgi:uncharacterized protein (UPF0276 family)
MTCPDLAVSLNNLGDVDLVGDVLADAGMSGPRPFVEILWDNYVAVDPAALAEMLAPLGGYLTFHVMWSRFLARPIDDFDAYLRHLRRHVDACRPRVVSDHLSRFTSRGLHLLFGQEHDYDKLDDVCARVDRYQDAIRAQLLLENNASSEHPVERQIDFIDAVQRRTGCGILFDISNAVVGELNGRGPVSVWLDYLAGRELRCHVGGYSYEPRTGMYHDTHAAAVSEATERAVRNTKARTRVVSVVYERDYEKSRASLTDDIRRLQQCLAT